MHLVASLLTTSHTGLCDGHRQIVLDIPEAAVYLMATGVEAAVAEAAAVAFQGESCALMSDFAASKLSVAEFRVQLESDVLSR